MSRTLLRLLCITIYCLKFCIATYDRAADHRFLQDFSISFEDFWDENCLDNLGNVNSRSSAEGTSSSQPLFTQRGPDHSGIPADLPQGKQQRTYERGNLNPMEAHQQSEQVAAHEVEQKKLFELEPETNDLPLLGQTESTPRCVSLAKLVYDIPTTKSIHVENLRKYENLYDDRLSQAKATRPPEDWRSKSPKYKVDGYPIMLIRLRNTEAVLIRPYRAHIIRDPARLERFQPRFSNLISAIDFFHEIASQGGLDEVFLGTKEDLRGQIVDWFNQVVFGRTQGSLPLIGSVENKDLPHELMGSQDFNLKRLKYFFGRPQLFISIFLTKQDLKMNESLVKIALSFIGYWYQNVAPLAEGWPRVSDQDFWREMCETLEKYVHSAS